MEYITTRRMRELAADGTRMNIPYGRTFQTMGDFIATPEGKGICYDTSEQAHRYFARNDDGRGLERGALSYAIAYAPRERYSAEGRRQRFTDEEIETLETDWQQFLVPDVDVILFNHSFFNAEPDVLRQVAAAVNIKVK